MKRLLAVLATLAALALTAVQASASQVFNMTIPAVGDPLFNGLANPCNGEAIGITGGADHVHLAITTDSSGGTHFLIDANIEGVKGVGAFGNPYEITAWFHSFGNFSTAGATVIVPESDVFHVISQNSTLNFVHEDVSHIVISPDGTMTRVLDSSHNSCAGPGGFKV